MNSKFWLRDITLRKLGAQKENSENKRFVRAVNWPRIVGRVLNIVHHSIIVVIFCIMHGQAASNLECNSRWGWPGGHCDECTWERHFVRRCMNILVKEKEYALGIDTNPRARSFYPADIGKYYKPHGNAAHEEHAEKTNNNGADTNQKDTTTGKPKGIEINSNNNATAKEDTTSTTWKTPTKTVCIKKQQDEEANSSTKTSASNRCSVLQEQTEEKREEIAQTETASIASETKNAVEVEKEIKQEIEGKCDINNISLENLQQIIEETTSKDKDIEVLNETQETVQLDQTKNIACGYEIKEEDSIKSEDLSLLDDESMHVDANCSEEESADNVNDEDEDEMSKDDSVGFTREERRKHKEMKEDGLFDEEASFEEDDVNALTRKIASLQYQNVLNIQRLHSLELEDEKRRKELKEKEQKLKKHETEIQESQKELIVKKKFAFSM